MKDDAVQGPTTERQQERFIMSESAKANKEADYYVDPNKHQPQESGPTEPAGAAKDGDLMIGEDTGGQDKFSGGNMKS
jgi:hypothetical protein